MRYSHDGVAVGKHVSGHVYLKYDFNFVAHPTLAATSPEAQRVTVPAQRRAAAEAKPMAKPRLVLRFTTGGAGYVRSTSDLRPIYVRSTADLRPIYGRSTADLRPN
jgi:hypothetical protein